MNPIFLIVPILLPLAAAVWLRLARPEGRAMQVGLMAAVLVNSALVWALLLNRPADGLELFRFTQGLSVTLRLDGMGSVFAGLVSALWPLATLYTYAYMEHDRRVGVFLTCYTLTYSVTLGIAFAGNLLTLYLFYELLTLATVPLVMHDLTPEALRAARKYLYYSLGGAAFAFMGIVFLAYYGATLDFTGYAAAVNSGMMLSHRDMMTVVYVLTFFGFSVKAAMFPFHGWLPTASVAPTPVTALLHAVAVVKSGAFAILRVTYFSYGTVFLAGTAAQKAVMAAAMVTVVFASTMAVKAVHFKRRLAYSTASNLSYILLAASVMTELGLEAALAHMVFHAVMKCCAFFCAGAVMHQADRHYIYELDGIGRKMPVVFTCFTVASLSLAGIPPLCGFLSKWSIAKALLTMPDTLLGWLGLASLMYAAFMSAVYMLTVVVRAFQPLPAGQLEGVHDPGWKMILPIGLLAAAVVVLGFCSQPLFGLFGRIAAGTL
ncbi:MAG: proton-conducting membrane transporter [Eubacteriales bacterium]|jgi:multicomponent Na+:H+ antiporter subunit D|nr:proton-conducting membrane transporter [Eubacteriales bacterium]